MQQKEKEESLGSGMLELTQENIDFALGVVKAFCNEYSNMVREKDELESTALLALCDSARRFDPSKEVSFHTYAYFRIRGSLIDYVRSQRSLRRFFKVRNKPSAATSNSAEQLTLPYSFASNPVELFQIDILLEQLNMRLVSNSEIEYELVYAEQKTPERLLRIKRAQAYILELISRLPEKERKIIELHYLKGQTLAEIAENHYEVSRSWVSRAHLDGLDKLRDFAAADNQKFSECSILLK